VDKARGKERSRPERGFRTFGKTVAFFWKAEPVGIEIAIHVLIMEDHQRIGAWGNTPKSQRTSFFRTFMSSTLIAERSTCAGKPFGASNSAQSTVPMLSRIGVVG
jgi:hypothetical protein